MAADVLKDPHLSRLVAQEQQRHSQKVERPRIARLGHVGGHGKPRPLSEKERVALLGKDVRIGVMLIGQAARLGHGGADAAQIA